MLDDLALSLMAFPQSWTPDTPTHGKLEVRVLVLPVGDPLGPVGSVARFSGTPLRLRAELLTGEALPASGVTPAFAQSLAPVPPPGAVALLQSMTGRLPAGTTITNGRVSTVPKNPVRVMKSLPPSYTRAAPFARPRDPALFVTGDGYGCAIAAQAPAQPVQKPPPLPKVIAWGQIVSYILRQPKLAAACGFVYRFDLTVSLPDVSDVSWLLFRIDTSDPGHPFATDAAKPDVVRSYAARLPPLTVARKLFAATLFPVVAIPQPTLAEADLEAQIYDDGFAQVVHSHQPPTADTATGDTSGIAPGAEPGIQLAWDDEQVTVWLDRQIGVLRDRVTGTQTMPEAPLGVLGYRIDVREPGTGPWHSLCAVTGSLPFSGASPTGTGTTPIGPDELFVTPSPVRAMASGPGPNEDPHWLPLYFANWRGSSLVVHDATVTALSAGTAPMPPSTLRGVPVAPPLYGRSYEFRVRLADLTGGGPGVQDAPVHAGPAQIETTPFRRHLPPKALRVEASPALPPPMTDGTTTVLKTPPARTLTKLVVRRPLIGYPEALFAGGDPADFTGAALDALVAAARARGGVAGVPDPDVDRFTVTVEAAIPAHDTGPAGEQPDDIDDAKWRVVYAVNQHFPAGADTAVVLALSYASVSDIAQVTPPADDAAMLTLPAGRDLRIRLTPLLVPRGNYYGAAPPPPGLVSDYVTRREAADEADLFQPGPQQLRACYLQPGDNLAALAAQALGLGNSGLTLIGPPGRRVVFAHSGALRCTLSPDRSSLTLANTHELLDHWIVALTIDIARDWTWSGFGNPALEIARDGMTIATVTVPNVVAASALGSASIAADRSTTRVVVLDAIIAHPPAGTLPRVLNPHYALTATFRSAPPLRAAWTTLRLPIATRPSQTPGIAATGIAESAFIAAPDYSVTALRDRYLWIEFEAPIKDPDDTYFGRVLAYGPDPLLASALQSEPVPPLDPEPPLPLDPEPVRAIFAGQDEDKGGLEAMTALVPAGPGQGGAQDGVHFLLPLPPGLGPDALALFGFWTYELRVGHAGPWSTAQARFGRPRRVAGVQHPPPRLTCAVWRTRSGVTVSAPFATSLHDGQPATDRDNDPQTQLWFMLYTQVRQADGAAFRNILLNRQEGFARGSLSTVSSEPLFRDAMDPRTPRGTAAFDERTIENLLRDLGLPKTSPLSVLAVEVLPGAPHRRGQERPAGDPLGRQLGQRRILRTSPLAAVPAIC